MTKLQKDIEKNNKGGWISIYRKLFESDLWLSKPFSKGQAWVDMIGLANFHNSFLFIRGIKVDLKRGQLAMCETKLAERWGWSRNKVRRYLSLLKTIQQISQFPFQTKAKTIQQTIQQKLNVIQIITIINYNEYQKNGTTNDTTNDTTSDTHPNNIISKEGNIYSAFYDSELEKSNNDPNYENFIKIIFKENIYDRPLNAVLGLKEQCSYKQFCRIMALKEKHNISLQPVLEEMENWKDLLKKHTTLIGSFRTFAKNRYPQIKQK
jgi:hypothetical protein